MTSHPAYDLLLGLSFIVLGLYGLIGRNDFADRLIGRYQHIIKRPDRIVAIVGVVGAVAGVLCLLLIIEGIVSPQRRKMGYVAFFLVIAACCLLGRRIVADYVVWQYRFFIERRDVSVKLIQFTAAIFGVFGILLVANMLFHLNLFGKST